MARPLTSAAVLVVAAVLALVSPARAQVDCSNPDNLCTGDPCVIGDVDLAFVCIVDFGTRTLVIEGPVDGRIIQFHAGAIAVNGPVRSPTFDEITLLSDGGAIVVDHRIRSRNQHAGGGANPAFITLTAGGDITVNQPIDAKSVADDSGGVITLVAGGNITLRRTIKAGAAFSAGCDCAVTLDAGALLDVRGKIDARGIAYGGDVVLRGDAGATVAKTVDARGGIFEGGNIEVTSTTGSVTISKPLTAAGDATVGPRVFASGAETSGGGAIRITSSGGNVVLDGTFFARGSGTIAGTAAGDLTSEGGYRATPSGCIALAASGTLSAGGFYDPALVPDCP